MVKMKVIKNKILPKCAKNKSGCFKYNQSGLTLLGHPVPVYSSHHIIIISGFGIYGAAVFPDSGVGNTWQRLTLVLHEFLSNGLTPSRVRD